ncbi:MAG: hypothetical protein ACHQ50_10340 [Fimbriimonadales bacterium]
MLQTHDSDFPTVKFTTDLEQVTARMDVYGPVADRNDRPVNVNYSVTQSQTRPLGQIQWTGEFFFSQELPASATQGSLWRRIIWLNGARMRERIHGPAEESS